jgi:hypothetical protein
MAVGICDLVITVRCEAKASHKIKMNNMSAINDSSDPIEDTAFHFMKASG